MELICPADAGYDRQRAVFDQRIDRRPGAIARCSSRDDVIAALALANARGLPFAVRCGGTTAAAVIDQGLVIDVSPMRGIEVDRDARTARVAAGATWSELDAATQEHGLAVTGGRVSWLGVAGVALSEGSGWLERSLGSTHDNIVGAEAVLPDGRIVHGDPPDGAVVTELRLRLHPVGPTLLCGFLGFPRRRAGEIGRAYRDLMAEAPPEVGGALVLFAGRGGSCQITFCFRGDRDEAERWIAELRELGPSLDAVAENPYTALQVMTDTQNPFGMRAELRTTALDTLPDDLLEAIVEASERPAPTLTRITLRPGGGALQGPRWGCEVLGLWPPIESLDQGALAWLDHTSSAIGAVVAAG
jgi:FAD/FMN-containing dehydrogenase